MNVQIKRVYDPVEKTDGKRVLVDRVWPRGLSKEKVQAALWLKEAAPSTNLRKWFGHDRARWEVFKERYRAELKERPEVLERLLELARYGRLTLLFSARDTHCNQAVALKAFLVSMSDKDESL
jgi:uncharacterized protein YeaO (DUF488 family)